MLKCTLHECATHDNQITWYWPLKAAVRVRGMWMCCDCLKLVYSPTGLATFGHVTVVWLQQQIVAKPVGLEKRESVKWEQGEEVANEEDEIQLPLPSTASRATRRSYSPLKATVSPSYFGVLLPDKSL